MKGKAARPQNHDVPASHTGAAEVPPSAVVLTCDYPKEPHHAICVKCYGKRDPEVKMITFQYGEMKCCLCGEPNATRWVYIAPAPDGSTAPPGKPPEKRSASRGPAALKKGKKCAMESETTVAEAVVEVGHTRPLRR